MKKIKHYTRKISEELQNRVIDNLGGKLKKNATYGDLFDYLHDKGYVIDLVPFFTFAFVDNTAYLLRIYKIDYKYGEGRRIYDELEDDNKGIYGGSFWLQVDHAIDIIIEDYYKK